MFPYRYYTFESVLNYRKTMRKVQKSIRAITGSLSAVLSEFAVRGLTNSKSDSCIPASFENAEATSKGELGS